MDGSKRSSFYTRLCYVIAHQDEWLSDEAKKIEKKKLYPVKNVWARIAYLNLCTFSRVTLQCAPLLLGHWPHPCPVDNRSCHKSHKICPCLDWLFLFMDLIINFALPHLNFITLCSCLTFISLSIPDSDIGLRCQAVGRRLPLFSLSFDFQIVSQERDRGSGGTQS